MKSSIIPRTLKTPKTAFTRTKALAGSVGVSLAVVLLPVQPTLPANGQPVSPFFQAVTNFNPAAYWPLQETATPPIADVETNYGSLGAVANAYYPSTNVLKGATPGAIVNSSDTAVGFSAATAGFLEVPNTDTRVSSLSAAFTIEVWEYPVAKNLTAANGILAKTGTKGTGGLNGGANSAGWSLDRNAYVSRNNLSVLGWCFHVYNGVGSTGGAEAIAMPGSLTSNTWYHVVGVFDGTNAYLYVDGTNATSVSTPMTGSYVPDTWDPLYIGGDPGRPNYSGALDEVAIYTNALTALQVSNHYYQAISGPDDAAYVSAVTGNQPLMYWRMNSPVYTAPAGSAYPVAANYGSAASINGLYLSGTTPGLSGPSVGGLGSPSYGCAFNGIGTDATNNIPLYNNGTSFGTIVANSGVVITNLDSSLNYINHDETLMCWFKADPADNRFQNLIGHGNSGFRLALYNGGGAIAWFFGAGGNLNSPNATYNDGNWHFAVGVYTNAGPASPVGWLGTNYLYVDGVQVNSGAVTNIQTVTGLTNQAVVLGGAPDYVLSGNGAGVNQRFFAGSLAHAAYFTNALTAAQIQTMYNAAQPPPAIVTQPAATPTGNGGTTNVFTVVASGAPTLAYQWYFNASSNYSGATALADGGRTYGTATASLTATNLQAGDAGYYYVVVTNNYGAATSILSKLSVVTLPVISAQNPAGPLNLFVNQSFTLSVTASGAPALSYQWYTNTVADTAAGLTSSYSLTAVQSGMSGSTYQCVVTNPFGSATSTLATLTVSPLPASIANSAYATNLLAFNPAAYWPMHEVATPAPTSVETNRGSLGALGNGYYADWASPIITHQVPGALVGDANPGVVFYNTSGDSLIIPHTSPQATIKAPFTLEAWIKPYANNTVSGSSYQVIMGQGGASGLNGGATRGGFALQYSGTPNTFSLVIWNGNGSGSYEQKTTAIYPPGQWYHVVSTFDGTNVAYYINGQQATFGTVSGSPGPMNPDSWSPLVIGAGRWGTAGAAQPFIGAMDEVAIYTNLLSQNDIQNHYNAGTSPNPSPTYAQAVQANTPLFYFRMDSPPYTLPPVSKWPVLTNYGTVGLNGVYSPGAMPGAAPGVTTSGRLAANLPGNNAMLGNGVSSYADAGIAPTLNPLNNTSFSYMAWFKGNPADDRSFQGLMSANDSTWRASINSSGKVQAHGNADIQSGVVNDGNWHLFVLTANAFDPPNTNYVNTLYIDGLVSIVSTNRGTNNPASSPGPEVLIGSATGFTNSSLSGGGRSFAGSICEAAFFYGTVLSTNQVRTVWDLAGVTPYLTTQPVSAAVNAGVVFTNTVAAFGSGTLGYQWYFNTSSNYGGATALSDTLDGRIFGTATNSLTFTNVHGSDAGYYYAVVTNNFGAATSSVAVLTVYTAPTFTLQPFPTNITLYAGGTTTFSVAATGASPIYYYWLSNNVPMASTTNTSYTLTNAQVSALYSCLASNYLGRLTSSVASVTVLASPTAPYPMMVLADNPVGYWRLNEPDDGSGNNGLTAHDYWGGNNGIYLNTILGQDGYSRGLTNQFGYYPATDPAETSAQFGYYNSASSNCVSNIPGITFATPTNTTGAFSIEAWAKGDASQSFNSGIVAKGAWAAEQFTLDTGGTSYSYRFTMRNSGTSPLYVTSNTNFPDGNWHHLVGVLDQAHSNACFYVDGIRVASLACSPSNGVLSTTVPVSIGCRLGSSGKYDQQFFGNVNDVAVYNYALSSTQVVNHYLAAGIPPTFTLQPVSSTNVNEGTTLSIPAQALGSLPLSYQWYDITSASPGTPIVDQTNATLVIYNINAALYDQHTLAVTVTNIYGQATSSSVYVSIVAGPPNMVTVAPYYLTVFAGQPAEFSVTAQGTVPFSYQWSVDGIDVPGATSASYTNIVQLGAHTIGCTVTNTAGMGSPAPATASLTGVAAPADNYALKILADKPLAYWRLDEPLYSGMANDYVGGHNGFYINVTNDLPGFSPSSPDTAAGLGMNEVVNDSLVQETDNSGAGIPAIDFSQQGANARFSVEAWVKAPAGQPSGAGIVTKGYGSGGEQFDLDVYGNVFRFFVRDAAGVTHGPTSTFPVDGNWHHTVGVCDEVNGSVYLYVDGALRASSAISPGLGVLGPLPFGSAILTSIGSRMRNSADGAYSLQLSNAVVDEVAIYNYALSSNQVVAHYLGAAAPPTISAEPWPVSIEAYEGITHQYAVIAAGTPPLHYQWYHGGTSIPDATNASYSLAVPLGTNNYSCIVTNTFGVTNTWVATLIGIPAPSLYYPQTILADSPIAYWRLDEGPDNGAGNADIIAHDYVGGHNASYNNVILGVAGYAPTVDPDAAAEFGIFAAPNSYAQELANGVANIDFSAANAEFSVEAWINGQGNPQSGAEGIVARGYFYGEQFSLDLGAPGTALRFEVRNAAGTAINANSTVVADANWHHLVGVCDEANGQVLIYIDGFVAGSATISPGSGLYAAISPIWIGARASYATNGLDQQFHGTMDEVAIYGYALSAGQVLAHYNASAGPPPGLLTITNLANGQVQLSWGFSGTLQAASRANGPYTNLTGVVSPYTFTATNVQQYFRVKQQ